MRRPATLTAGSAIACLLDLLLAPFYFLMAVFAAYSVRSGDLMPVLTMVMVGGAIAGVAAPVVAFVAGLLGAPRRLVLAVALVPIVGPVVLGIIGSLIAS